VYSLWPFGRTVVSRPGAGVASGIANVIWVVVAGLVARPDPHRRRDLPFGIANVKLVPVASWPLGRDIVEMDG